MTEELNNEERLDHVSGGKFETVEGKDGKFYLTNTSHAFDSADAANKALADKKKKFSEHFKKKPCCPK